jgi:hypothetical protein
MFQTTNQKLFAMENRPFIDVLPIKNSWKTSFPSTSYISTIYFHIRSPVSHDIHRIATSRPRVLAEFAVELPHGLSAAVRGARRQGLGAGEPRRRKISVGRWGNRRNATVVSG